MKTRWAQTAAVELLAYLLLTSGFLGLYIVRFSEPAEVIGYHLAVVGSILGPPFALRALIWKLGRQAHYRTFAVALLMFLPFTLFVVFYLLVLIGLDSWGRVTTWSLVRAYGAQAPHLLDALGLSPIGVLSGVVAGALALVVVVWRYLAPHDWIGQLAAAGTKSGIAVIFIGVTLIAFVSGYSLMHHGVGHPREPITLSFAAPISGTLQSHGLARSTTLDAREDEYRRTYLPTPTKPGRNLVLIVGDALRAEHMSIYGYERKTTPALSAIMRERAGIAVPRVRAACAESSCGLMALAASREVSLLGSAPFTLQEVLRRNGYSVHFILGGDHTNFYGLRNWYGELDSFRDGSSQTSRYMNDDELVLDAVAELPEAPAGHPTAFQFHLMSTHGVGKRDRDLSRFQPSDNYYGWRSPSPKVAPDFGAAQAAVNYYDNGVLGFDSHVSKLLTQLESKGYLEEALVVITGDHGEMLGEQSWFGHQHGVSEQVLDIPLVILRYGYDGDDISGRTITGQIDIAPTILRELGVPVPGNWKGFELQTEAKAREYVVQQQQMFGIYQVDDEGRVLKYERDMDSGTELVTDPIDDPLAERNLIGTIAKPLLDRWRLLSTSTMFVRSGRQ